MKKAFFTAVIFLSVQVFALEYEQQIDNDQIAVSRVKISPNEEIGLHRDVYPQVVVALQGGTITRLEADGKAVDVQFPTGVAVFRQQDPEGELHKSVNRTSKSIELIIIQLKNNQTHVESRG